MDPAELQLREHLARNIRTLRARRKLTIEQAAEEASLDPRRWQKLEAGESNATLATLGRIAATLEVSIADLLRHQASARKR